MFSESFFAIKPSNIQNVGGKLNGKKDPQISALRHSTQSQGVPVPVSSTHLDFFKAVEETTTQRPPLPEREVLAADVGVVS